MEVGVMIKLFKRIVGALTPTKRKSTVFYGPDRPNNAKKGDVWFDTKCPQQPIFHQF